MENIKNVKNKNVGQMLLDYLINLMNLKGPLEVTTCKCYVVGNQVPTVNSKLV